MKNRPRNVLIFPGGNEVGLEIWRSLKDCKETRVFGASSNVSNHAPFVYKEHATLPDVFTDGWVDELNALIERWHIDYVYPAHDYVIEKLVAERDRVHAKIVACDQEVIAVAQSKRRTLELYANIVPTPEIFDDYDTLTFPVFVKPDRGYGGQGAHVVRSKSRLDELLATIAEPLVTEYLPGAEYTIDCFSDRERGLLFAEGRERARIRMGTSMRSYGVDATRAAYFRETAQKLLDKLPLRGGWFFQMKEAADGTLKLMEIGNRIAGTMALHRARGVNFPLLSIFEMERIPVHVASLPPAGIVIDRSLANRFTHPFEYSRVYIDFDDTIVVHDRINTDVIKFLYQARNRGCELVLLTKYLGDIRDALARWRLSGLFDTVIPMQESERKADHIDPRSAIFIDDSFSERQDVERTHGIPTFDSSMIELLLDDRV